MTTVANKNRVVTWGLLAAILAAIGLVIWWAPAEQTMGQGIRIVYLHVALTWTGMTGFALAGILGLGTVCFSFAAW